MHRTGLKIFCLFVITLLVCGPIVTIKTGAQENQPNKYKNAEVVFTDGKIQEILYKINETLVRRFLEYLVFDVGCRFTGSDGCQKAAGYLYDQFKAMGLQVRYQNWSSRGNKWNPEIFLSQNIEATHQGLDPQDDEVIIFNAHYDTVQGTVGANDDGSGTVGVLAAAYVLSQYSFKRTMKFVTVSGEEEGLLGSHAYATELYQQHTPVLVEFNADMIGKATTAEQERTIRLSLTEDAGWIADIMKNMTNEYGLHFNITGGWSINRDGNRGGSDYFDFIRLGYESVCVWQGGGDPNYHSPQDNFSNVNLSYLVNTTRHIAATMAILGDAEIEVPQVSITNPRHREIYYKDTIRQNTDYNIPIVLDETNIYAEVKQGIYPIDRVEFYYDNKLLFTDTEKPYVYLLNKRSLGFHTIQVIVYDTNGNSATDHIKILFFNSKYF